MSKIAHYLNEHILGDVTTDIATRKLLANDGSMLSMTPELVVYPRVTNDIRKVTRFTHQLAEKGHIMSVTARGAGSDQTGAAISDGILVQTAAHMNNIFEFDSKQRLIRVQPGALFGSVNAALKLQGHHIPAPVSSEYSTIGGAVANNAGGELSGRYGAMDSYVEELEVVLANGDAIQTSRLTKRELNKKKGQQNLEGEIYRAVDNLITDNQTIIDDKLDAGAIDNSGYASIAKVRNKNGSFDLTPLFVGAQGTLGIISEMILKTEFYGNEQSAAVMAFGSNDELHDMLDEVRKLEPELAEVYDGALFKLAMTRGKRHSFVTEALEANKSLAGVVVCEFSDFSERTRKKKSKKLLRLAKKFNASATRVGSSREEVEEIRAVKGHVYAASQADTPDSVTPPLFGGVYVPEARFEEFIKAVEKLAREHKVRMPFSGHVLDSVYHFWPQFSFRTVAEKQKMLKLYDTFVETVIAHGGAPIAEGAEGRLKAPFIQKHQDESLAKLYTDLRAIFDPYATLNSGVKQPAELRSVVGHLRPHYSTVQRADYAQ